SITLRLSSHLFIFNALSPTEIYTLYLHDALPICTHQDCFNAVHRSHLFFSFFRKGLLSHLQQANRTNTCSVLDRSKNTRTLHVLDRKSTRLNSSLVAISYAVFCLKKKKSPGNSNL